MDLICSASAVFRNLEFPDDLSVAKLDDALFIPVTRVPASKEDKSYPVTWPRRSVSGIIGEDGVAVPESRQRRFGRDMLRYKDGDIKINNPNIYKGRYIYGGIIFDAYGHFITETLARAWYLIENRKEDIDGIVFHRVTAGQSDASVGWLKEALSIIGIDESKIIVPAVSIFERLEVPAPSFEISTAAHPALKTAFEAMASFCAPDIEKRRCAYISRTNLSRRRTWGEKELEEIMSRYIDDIIYFDDMSIRDKISLVNKYESFISLAGSGLHNLLFKLNPANVYVINRFSQIHSNYPLADHVKGLNSVYAMVGKDHPDGGFWPPYIINVADTVAFLIGHGLLPQEAMALAEKVDQDALEANWREECRVGEPEARERARERRRLGARFGRMRTRALRKLRLASGAG